MKDRDGGVWLLVCLVRVIGSSAELTSCATSIGPVRRITCSLFTMLNNVTVPNLNYLIAYFILSSLCFVLTWLTK